MLKISKQEASELFDSIDSLTELDNLELGGKQLHKTFMDFMAGLKNLTRSNV